MPRKNPPKPEPDHMTKPRRPRPSAEEFIRCWQTSSSTLEVAEKLGMRRGSVIERSLAYRREGIPLKEYDARTRPPHNDLVALALSLGGKGG